MIEATGDPKEYVMMVKIFHQNEPMSLQKYLNLNPKSRPLLPFVRTQEGKGYERVVCLTLTSRGVTEETFHWNTEQQELTSIEVREKPEFGALSMEAWRYQNNVMRGIIDVFPKHNLRIGLHGEDNEDWHKHWVQYYKQYYPYKLDNTISPQQKICIYQSLLNEGSNEQVFNKKFAKMLNQLSKWLEDEHPVYQNGHQILIKRSDKSFTYIDLHKSCMYKNASTLIKDSQGLWLFFPYDTKSYKKEEIIHEFNQQSWSPQQEIAWVMRSGISKEYDDDHFKKGWARFPEEVMKKPDTETEQLYQTLDLNYAARWSYYNATRNQSPIAISTFNFE